jgi:hypothetical protein
LGLMAYGKTWTRMGPWDLGEPSVQALSQFFRYCRRF